MLISLCNTLVHGGLAWSLVSGVFTEPPARSAADFPTPS